MTSFEFFMAFYGLLLGLAVAELLQGFGNLLRDRVQPRWGILTPLLGLEVFAQILATFTDTWRSMQDVHISAAGMTVPALIGISYFTAAVMAVPRDPFGWPSLDDYFHDRKRFTVGSLLLTNLLTIAFLELPHSSWRPSVGYILVNALLILSLAIPLLTRHVRVAAVALAVNLAILVAIYWSGLTIAAQFKLLFG